MDYKVKIEKKDMNVYWFDFISSTFMPSKNESILRHPKVVLVGTIIDKEKINVGSIIEDDIPMHASQEKTSLSFPIFMP